MIIDRTSATTSSNADELAYPRPKAAPFLNRVSQMGPGVALNVAKHSDLDHHGPMSTRTQTAREIATAETLTTPQKLIFAGLAVLGIGLAATGVVAVFATENGPGTAALLLAGAILVLVAALADRLESLRYGDVELLLRRKAAKAKSRGDTETAEALERAADTIGRRVSQVAHSYRTARGDMLAGPERTARMDGIIAEARNDAHRADLDEEDVLRLVWTGSEGARVWALGVLQERPELATTRAVLEAVQRPDQMFDQYQALVLADRFITLPTTHNWAQQRIATAVRAQLESGALGDDVHCQNTARQLLDRALS
jgi:hypothetical protein